MAKVNVEFDTEEKSLNVSVNGKNIGEVDSVSFFRFMEHEYGEEMETKTHCTIYMSNKEDGVEVATQYYVRGTKEAYDASKTEGALFDLEGFIGKKVKDLSGALANFFTSKSRFR